MLERAIANLAPRPRARLLEWSRENIQTDSGRPYDHSAYPHIGAPGGPMDAYDCPQYLTIWLQWASRLGKSFFGQCGLMKAAACDPCPMMFASSDQKLGVEVTARTYRMLERCPPLRDQLRPVSRRKQDCVELGSCRIFVAWSRSVSTLADKAVRVGHGNEVDKWEHVGADTNKAKEADPLELFSDRFKEFPSHKRIMESTPALKHSSRIERGRLASTNCAYWVPCPKCWRYQLLKMDRVRWDKTDAGKSEKDLARETAHYVCEHCQEQLHDEHRGPMMRAGVWVPEGCTVDDAKARETAESWPEESRPWPGWSLSEWIVGSPIRDGRDAGYQLSSLYAISLTWGDIAAKFVDCKKNPQNLRNFVNQWLAETWETIKHKATWEQVGKRLIGTDKIGVVPQWASIITVGIDKQGDDRYPWVVDAWGPERRSATICYGQADSLEWIAENVIRKEWPHADGRTPVKPCIALIDSGNRPAGVYEFVIQMQRQGVNVLACKGSSTALNADWRLSTLDKNTSLPGMQIYLVDTIRSQLWMDLVIHSIKPDEPGGTSLFSGSLSEHEDFLQQIINDAAVESLDKSNNSREAWERINSNIPNDYRDCRRYGYIGMLIATRGGPIHKRNFTPPPAPVEAPGRIRPLKIRGR